MADYDLATQKVWAPEATISIYNPLLSRPPHQKGLYYSNDV